jgi:hypothetical protein
MCCGDVLRLYGALPQASAAARRYSCSAMSLAFAAAALINSPFDVVDSERTKCNNILHLAGQYLSR